MIHAEVLPGSAVNHTTTVPTAVLNIGAGFFFRQSILDRVYQNFPFAELPAFIIHRCRSLHVTGHRSDNAPYILNVSIIVYVK